MNRITLCVLFVLGCATHESSNGDPLLQGDECAVHEDRTSCAAKTGCIWYDIEAPCEPGKACPGGVCQSATGGGSGEGSGSGGSSTKATCTCGDGRVCFEQIGGPAEQSGGPSVECTAPLQGGGDPCTRIVGEGTCTDSVSVNGLCICDNGIR